MLVFGLALLAFGIAEIVFAAKEKRRGGIAGGIILVMLGVLMLVYTAVGYAATL